MKRNISLYIGDERVELDDQSFILYNWTMEDLTNPTAVKNSYSQSLTIKGTAQNNRIFGECFRVDRMITHGSDVYTGVGFDPTRKTPFSICAETEEVLQQGYVKLDSVLVSGSTVSYNVTLYGGLGSFFYFLSYDEEGNKRTLADLDYLGTDDPDTELDFDITAANVRGAWNALYAGTAGKWQVVNFAPCYNGIPEGNFSADKAIAIPQDIQLPAEQKDGNKTYSTKGQYTLVNLAQEHDEWAMKDLRSYLQRPVFSMESFIKAICKPENNGGYTVDVSSLVKADGTPMYRDLWMTLPMLTELNLAQTELDVSLVSSTVSGDDGILGKWTVRTAENLPSNTKMSATFTFIPVFSMSTALSDTPYLLLSCEMPQYIRITAIFLQVVAYSGNTPIGGSKVACISDFSRINNEYTPQQMAKFSKYSPVWDDNSYEDTVKTGSFVKQESIYYQEFALDSEISLSIESTGPVTEYRLLISCQNYLVCHTRNSEPQTGNNLENLPYLYTVNSEYYQAILANSSIGSRPPAITAEIPDGDIRSGALITKRILLSTEHTPAEYLLSYCKLYGLHFLYDNTDRTISIVTRNDLYREYIGKGYIYLQDRIDLSHDMEIVPFVFQSKWYDFSLESDGGEFWDNYQTQYGIDYGMQRVDTGYDFEADNINLMDDNVFRNAATVLERSAYFNYIQVDRLHVPSVFVDKENTYTLWDSDGDGKDFDITSPPDSATVTYMNQTYEGYDFQQTAKLQFHDNDGRPLDGSGVLVKRCGTFNLEGWYNLSDDMQAMFTLNDGKPCWVLTSGAWPINLYAPLMRRIDYDSDGRIEHTLDFGRVRELSVPGIGYGNSDSTIYELYWKEYLTDRYDRDTKIMRCRVDLSGLDVGQKLLSRFYWYENALWVLNKITNYSFTTYDTAECEFVQVQDETAYVDGQKIE